MSETGPLGDSEPIITQIIQHLQWYPEKNTHFMLPQPAPKFDLPLNWQPVKVTTCLLGFSEKESHDFDVLKSYLLKEWRVTENGQGSETPDSTGNMYHQQQDQAMASYFLYRVHPKPDVPELEVTV